MVTLKGKFEPADVIAAQDLHARSSQMITWVGYYMLGLVGLTFIAGIVLAAMQLLPWSFSLYPAVILGAVGVYRYYLRPAQITRSFNQNKDLSSPFEMELNDDGYNISNSYGSGHIPWKDFVRWKADSKMILLYRTNTMFNMVPKRLLHGETEAQYILDTLRQNDVPMAGKSQSLIENILWRLVAVLLLLAVIALVYMNIRNMPH